MTYVEDRYMPSIEGADTIFTDIINCELESKPTRTGFFTGPMFFRKRDGVLDTGQSVGGTKTLEYALNDNQNIWGYNTNGEVYLMGSLLTASTLIKTGLYYINTALHNILDVRYLGGGKWIDGSNTTFTIDSYNPTTGVVTMPTGSGHSIYTDSTHNVINYYMYVVSGSGILQYRRVDKIDTVTTPGKYLVTLESPFSATIDNTSVVTFFAKDNAQQKWFVPIRKDGTTNIDYIYAYDETTGLTDHDLYWSFPKVKKLLFRNNYPVSLLEDGKTIIIHNPLEYERLYGTPIETNSQVINIDVYGGYLFVFYSDKIGVIRQDIIPDSTGTSTITVFKYQDGANTGLYSQYAYSVEGDQMYFVGNDRVFYSLAIDIKSNGNVVLDPTNQGDTIYNFLKGLVGGQIYIYNKGSILRVVHQLAGATYVYKYYINYKLWLRDTYTIGGNFYNFYFNIDGVWYTAYTDKLVSFNGRKDLTNKIRQYILMYGPEQGMFSEITILQAKLKLGMTGEPIAGNITITVNGSQNTVIKRDLVNHPLISSLNTVVNSNGTMGTTITGTTPFGGFASNAELQDYIATVYPEIITMGMFIGKLGSNFKIEIENNGFDQLYFGGINIQYQATNPLIISRTMMLD